jgi:hypothetical protein
MTTRADRVDSVGSMNCHRRVVAPKVWGMGRRVVLSWRRGWRVIRAVVCHNPSRFEGRGRNHPTSGGRWPGRASPPGSFGPVSRPGTRDGPPAGERSGPSPGTSVCGEHPPAPIVESRAPTANTQVATPRARKAREQHGKRVALEILCCRASISIGHTSRSENDLAAKPGRRTGEASRTWSRRRRRFCDRPKPPSMTTVEPGQARPNTPVVVDRGRASH